MSSILTNLPQLTAATNSDWLYIVDVSDTTDNPAGSSKKILRGDLYAQITGFTYLDNTITLSLSDNSTYDVVINTMTGLTINGVLSATTYENLPLDVFVTGGSFSSGVLTLTNNSGGTFNVSGFTSIDTYTTGFTYNNNRLTIQQNNGQPDLNVDINSFTGLTIDGTISATTYENLPLDVFTTGGTYSDGTLTFTNNSGGTFNVSGLYTGSTDIYTTGGTYNNTTGIATFTNNSGGTFDVSGFFKTSDNTYTTGFTFNVSNYDLTIKQNNGETDLTVNLGILSSDITITGGTYNPTTGIATFTNNTGGTFSVSGFLTGMTDTYVSGFTYSNNNLTIKQTAGQPDLTVNISTMTGLTITGNLTVTGGTQSWFSGNSASDLVRITQTGSGNALVVEDANNPDASPFVVNATGNVGIGTTTPAAKFEIKSAAQNNLGGLLLRAAASANYPVLIYETTNQSGVLELYSGSTLTTQLYANGFSFFNGGNVGIGTTTPTAKLHINHTGSGNSFLVEDSTNPDSTPFVIDNNGIVGIGVSNPSGFNARLVVVATTSGEYGVRSTGFNNHGMIGNTAGIGYAGVYGINSTDAFGTGIGVYGRAEYADTPFNGQIWIGGKFEAVVDPVGTSYSVQLLDGTEGINKILVSQTSDGKANWSSTLSGLTGVYVNTISATTYYNLPLDVFTTGGTYNNTTGIATFTNNSGGTFNVSGFFTGSTDNYTTGFTYNNNTFTIKRNNGLPDLSATINTMTGLTINGDVNITGQTTYGSISATTYYNLPLDVFTTGGTYSNGTLTFTNNSGGTFNVSGLITGDTYWTSGSTGDFSIKAKNDSIIDSTGNYAVAEGRDTLASGIASHAEGFITTASGDYGSHSEGDNTLASGEASHAEGVNTIASGDFGSHAEGDNTTASGERSHAEGGYTTASGQASHSEGSLTTASGFASHAGGNNSAASGDTSFIHSTNSKALGDRSVVLGGQNITGTTDDTVYVPYFNIQSATTDNSLTEFLVKDINGDVKTRGVDTITFTGGTVPGPTIFTGGVTANTLNVTGLTQTSGITSTGGITFKQITINSSYTATTSDYMIDVSGGTFTVSLPSAIGIQGRLLVIKNNGGGAVTVDPYGSETIDDKPFVILGETNSVQLTSNGVNWVAMGYNISTVNSSTGVFEFTGLTKLTDTTFNVGEVKGWIVDDTTNPLSPQLYYVYYSGGSHTALYVNTASETWVYLTSGGTVAQQSTPLTTTQRRVNIFLGKLGHANLTSIINTFSQPDYVLSPLAQLRDMFLPINIINGGIYPSPNGVNLKFNTSAGYIYGLGINFASDTLNPNSLYVSGNTPTTFQYRTQTGGTATNTTDIDPTNYDVGGVVTPITGTKATNQRIYLVQNGGIRVMYGQTTYNNFSDAVQGLQTETFTPFSNFVNNGVLIGILTVLSTATDLTDTSKAKFFFASKFGETVGAAGGVSTTTLQQAYNNSTNPEITTNSTLNAVQFRGGTGNDADANIVMENNAGVQTGKWLANGGLSATTISATTISATTYQNLPLDVFTTGGTYNSGTGVATFTNNSGGTFSVSGFSSSSFTGGVVSGATNFTGGLTANTISATTYNNLPKVGFSPINVGVCDTAPTAASTQYYYQTIGEVTTTLSKVKLWGFSGSDLVLFGIYRGTLGGSMTLIGQARGTCSIGPNELTLSAETGQNLTITAGEDLVVGYYPDGTSWRTVYDLGISDILFGILNTGNITTMPATPTGTATGIRFACTLY
jgi:hypothetical protein